jgi:alkaline phosphatase
MAGDAIKKNRESMLSKTGQAKNVVFFIGDGMGPTTVTAGRWHMMQQEALKAYDTVLSWDKFPTVGLSKV